MSTEGRHAAHHSAREAKEFLATKIVHEAALEGKPLSELERKMLHFTESDGPNPEMLELNDKFEEQYDTRKYESKISRLIRNAYKRDRKSSPDQVADWWKYIRTLEKGDHYILVMVDRAHLRPPGDFLKLIGTAIGLIAVSLPFIYFLDSLDISDPFLHYLLRYAYVGFVALFWVLISPRRRRVLWEVLGARVRRPR